MLYVFSSICLREIVTMQLMIYHRESWVWTGHGHDMEELSCLLTLVNAWYTAQGPETGGDSSIMQQQE